MKDFGSPVNSGHGQPIPAEKYRSTEKTYYQHRTTWGPRNGMTGPMNFRNSEEGAKRNLAAMPLEMSYTEINGGEPTPMEKGHAIDQGRMGAGGNRLVHEHKFG